jgi:hypothetical protein
MSDEEDLTRLIVALRGLAPLVRKSTDRAWSRPPAVRAVDCVLSLNRDYDRFVVRRLDQFEYAYPNVRSITDLQALIAKFPTPNAFVKTALTYNHEERANTLDAVVQWLVSISRRGPDQAQLLNLERWARDPQNYPRPTIRGFGLAGFQYLRMLFGANTTKPDLYIRKFVESCIGRLASPVKTLQLLEEAAQRTGIRLRDLDTTIWEIGARNGRCTDTR